ncbi:MAG: PIG-L deacetylase family protein, partial [Acidimicrobiia bacterium]
FLDQVDGELEESVALRSAIARHIRVVRPDVVLGHDPWKRHRLHPDHRHAGFLTCDAIVAARDPHFFREHGIPHHRPRHLLLWEADEPNHGEDVSQHLETKIDALMAHASQFESTMKAVDPAELERFAGRMRERAGQLGARFGRAAGEVFTKLSDF